VKPKFSAAVIVLASCAALLLAGSAVAGGKAETKVKIKAESGGFFGYVKSSDPQTCAADRKVTLFKQKGKHQKPKKDVKIGTDLAQANGDKYMWSTGNTGSHKGHYYAKAGKIPGCKAGYSKTNKAQD
jgi:hypothetical protein